MLMFMVMVVLFAVIILMVVIVIIFVGMIIIVTLLVIVIMVLMRLSRLQFGAIRCVFVPMGCVQGFLQRHVAGPRKGERVCTPSDNLGRWLNATGDLHKTIIQFADMNGRLHIRMSQLRVLQIDKSVARIALQGSARNAHHPTASAQHN